jgi:heme exporter protein A
VDLTLSAGECLALFGPNGAGKTTLLRLIAGLLKPTAGTVRVQGVDVRRDAQARSGVGLISHHSMLYAPLTALENVEFTARLYGLPDPRAAARSALESMQVFERAHVPVRTLSRGLQQRVSIARATVHEPSLVLLDEPYSGLDEAGAAALTSLLQSLRARGATLVVVTHNVGEGLALATHAAIMTEGRFARFEQRGDAHGGGGLGFDAQRYAAEYRELVRHAG